jgi:hypothetical protein
MTAYSWTIYSLITAPNVGGLTNVVVRVEARHCATTEGGLTVSNPRTLITGPADPESFTPFAELTQAQVIGWIEELLGEELIALYQQGLDQLLVEAQNTVNAPPWA